MVYNRNAVLEFPRAPPFERAMSSSAPDDAKTPRRTSNTGNVRGLPAAVVEGRRAAEAARRRGAWGAVRRVALGRVDNGAFRARGGSGARRYFSRCSLRAPRNNGALGSARRCAYEAGAQIPLGAVLSRFEFCQPAHGCDVSSPAS